MTARLRVVDSITEALSDGAKVRSTKVTAESLGKDGAAPPEPAAGATAAPKEGRPHHRPDAGAGAGASQAPADEAKAP